MNILDRPQGPFTHFGKFQIAITQSLADLEGGRLPSRLPPPFGDGPTYAVSTTPSLTAYVGPSPKGGYEFTKNAPLGMYTRV